MELTNDLAEAAVEANRVYDAGFKVTPIKSGVRVINGKAGRPK